MPDALDVPCPECSAEAGEPCHGVSRRGGRRRDRVTVHKGRQAALEARPRRDTELVDCEGCGGNGWVLTDDVATPCPECRPGAARHPSFVAAQRANTTPAPALDEPPALVGEDARVWVERARQELEAAAARHLRVVREWP